MDVYKGLNFCLCDPLEIHLGLCKKNMNIRMHFSIFLYTFLFTTKSFQLFLFPPLIDQPPTVKYLIFIIKGCSVAF